MPEEYRPNDYDSDSWFYCASCFSPNIRHEDAIDSDCCGSCGCTNIVESTIEEWEKLYMKRYGHKYAEKSNNIRNSPIFKLSISKLMTKVADSPKWKAIITEIYRYFPRGLSKADSVVLFFDKLLKDNKLDSLKELLYKWKI